MIDRNNSKKMTEDEFEKAVGCMIETYHLPVEALPRRHKGFPLNDYAIVTPQELVKRYDCRLSDVMQNYFEL